MDTFIAGRTRNRAGRRLLLWAVLAAAIALQARAQARYTRNFLHGPFALTAADLDAVGDPARTPRVFVRVTGSESVDMAGGRPSSGHYALRVGPRQLVYTRAGGQSTTIQGEIRPFEHGTQIHYFGPQVPPTFYPFYVDGTTYYRAGGVAEAIGLGLFGLLGALLVPREWNYWLDPAAHRLVKRSATWGDPIAVDEAVWRESREPRLRLSGWRLTDHYAIHETALVFDVFRWTDLLWAYQRITLNRAHLVRGATHTAALHWRDGTAVLAGTAARLDEVLAFAAERAPAATFGFSAEARVEFLRRRREV